MIDQTNYETWFLLYADAELSDKEQEMVLRFAERHPELKTELDAMMQLRFLPETDILFPDHSVLIKKENEAPEDPYRFEPDLNITFPHKASLYRKAKPVRTLWIRALSAAAAVLIVVGLFGVLIPFEDENRVASSVPVASSISTGPSSITPAPDPSAVVAADQKRTEIKAVTSTSRSSSGSAPSATPQRASAVEPEPPQIPALVVQLPSDARTSIVKTTNDRNLTENPVKALAEAPAPPRSNFTEAALASGRERETAEAVLNTEVFIQAALKEEKNTPFRGLIRKISRRVLHEREEDSDQRYIKVALFSIPVQKHQ